MNWPVIALLLVIGGFAGGTYFGHDYANKQYAEKENIRLIAWGEALDKAAERVGKVNVTNRTIYQQGEKVIERETVLKECKNPPDMVDAINRAAKGVDK